MKPGIRRERIVDLVRERERVSVDDLAALLGSSRETIRRDLTELAGRGLIRKVHGGAMMPEVPREGAFPARLSEAIREKRAVARAAAALFGAGDTLFIDTGTTTLLFAEELARRPGVLGATAFGQSIHVSGEDRVALEAAIAPYRREPFAWREIEPTLEDVFIRMMGAAEDNAA